MRSNEGQTRGGKAGQGRFVIVFIIIGCQAFITMVHGEQGWECLGPITASVAEAVYTRSGLMNAACKGQHRASGYMCQRKHRHVNKTEDSRFRSFIIREIDTRKVESTCQSIEVSNIHCQSNDDILHKVYLVVSQVGILLVESPSDDHSPHF